MDQGAVGPGTVSSVNVRPLPDVSVGTTIPTSVTLHICPGEAVRCLNGIAECRFAVVNNRTVIGEPSTRRVATVMERQGRPSALHLDRGEGRDTAPSTLRIFGRLVGLQPCGRSGSR